jgi:sec-independent protein translocase protein TatA
MGLDNPLHIAFLVVILLLVFGARRLPEIGRSLGSGMREFKTSVTGEMQHPQQTLPPVGTAPQQSPPPAQVQVQVAQAPAQQAQPAAPPPPPQQQVAQVPAPEPVATPAAPPDQTPAA